MHRRLALALLALLLPVMLGACSWTSFSMDQADSVQPSSDTVVIVGKMVLTPPIDPEYEQKTHWNAPGDGDIINRVFMLTAPDQAELDMDDPDMADFKNNIPALWGEMFFLESPRQRTYLRAGMMILDSMRPTDRIWFPAGYYYDVPPNASAIYIGTLRYTRDDFYVTKKLELLDEYNQAVTAFRKKFGASAKLEKSLLKKSR